MTGIYKVLTMSELEDNKSYLIVYKTGWNSKKLTKKLSIMTKHELQKQYEYTSAVADTMELDAIIELDAYLKLLLTPYLKDDISFEEMEDYM